MWSCDSGTLRVGSGPGLQRPLPTPPPLLGLLMEEAQSGSVRDSLLASGGEAGLKDTWYSQVSQGYLVLPRPEGLGIIRQPP